MAKTYILQKELPNSKTGDKYIWMETGVAFDAYYHNGNIDGSYWLRKNVENNIEWFKEYIQKTYTEEDMRKCFEASREIKKIDEFKKGTWVYDIRKFETFNEYLKIL